MRTGRPWTLKTQLRRWIGQTGEIPRQLSALSARQRPMGKEGPGKDPLLRTWSDPADALRRYQAYCASDAADNGKSNRPAGIGEHLRSRATKTRSVGAESGPRARKSSRPRKPHRDFPLFAHPNGQCAKRTGQSEVTRQPARCARDKTQPTAISPSSLLVRGRGLPDVRSCSPSKDQGSPHGRIGVRRRPGERCQRT